MSTVISVENISKQYRLGEVGTGTLSHDLNRWWHKVRGKEDPYLKIGEVNDRTKKAGSQGTEDGKQDSASAGTDSSILSPVTRLLSPASSASADYAWALRDVSFEVKQGEVLGIIGRNGAGKSTLLKILSRVTTPTTGQIKVKGRIASLLEVGTGFHPELTGRENIYLNGAILGMRKQEITRKLDEIIDFSGCERYIDTPVKRYSSGMYVRLAFAVAAHLEPEILIVDEVLAVGDAEFQKKCLGKMKDVAREGRTVIFVSHNIEMIERLTGKCAWLSKGVLLKIGETLPITSEYADSSNAEKISLFDFKESSIPNSVNIESVNTRDTNGCFKSVFRQGQKLLIELVLDIKTPHRFDVAIVIETDRDFPLFTTHLSDSLHPIEASLPVTLTTIIDPAILRSGRYKVSLAVFSVDKIDFYDVVHHFPLFEISGTENFDFPDDTRWGCVYFKLPWVINKQ